MGIAVTCINPDTHHHGAQDNGWRLDNQDYSAIIANLLSRGTATEEE
jgi:hypothetical protein